MIRKTALLTGIAGAMLMAAPAFAQDAMSPQPSPAQAPAAATAAPAEPETLTLQPGANIKGSDGAALGVLEGTTTSAEGEQQLTVRGTDGQLRAVPLAGLRPEGTDVVVGWTAAEYQAAPAIAGEAAVDASATAPSTMPADPAAASDDAMTPEASDTPDPMAPDTATPDTVTPAPTDPQA